MNLLEVRGVHKAFGGVQAIYDISMTIAAGELSAIIGPNGAGKTTFFNLVTGYYQPDQGEILFKGKNITKLSSHRISKLGIGRAFQGVTVFSTMSVLENILIPLIVQKKNTFNFRCFTRDRKDLQEEAMKYLTMVDLGKRAESPAQMLSHGEQKRLEIGIALATESELLLLDEPTAGMSPSETRVMVMLVKKLSFESKKTIIFTEHDMEVVFGTAEKIRVLHMGSLIAEGNPEEISKNEEVKKAYLGG